MKTLLRTFRICTVALSFLFALPLAGLAQGSSRSLLINHGGTACGNASPEDHFFASSLTTNPTLVHSTNVGVPYYSVFTAYNPADHKVYYADIGGAGTKVYALDFNFGGTLASPTVSSPTYVYNYTLNQLCFDNYGNNYGFYNFDGATGTAVIAKVDIATGAELAGTARTVQFPAGHIPNNVYNGDIVILPNGRMFATFGDAPSTLYELSNPTAAGTVTATYLASLPRVCFSIGFVDGNLVVAGSDGGGCYYFVWDINSVTLSNAFAFPGGKNSADMSSMTLAVGCSKQLTGAGTVNNNTANVYYRIVVKNNGNILLNNLQVTDDLAKVFGAGNVTAVSVSFVSNPGGLQLNPGYNGTTDINLLAPNQTLNNHPVATDSVVINMAVTATNLSGGTVYYNSAIASGSIGAGSTYMAVADSSNNGSSSRMDLDGNGLSDDAGENTPTPFVFVPGLLPVNGFSLQGTRHDEVVALRWNVTSAQEISGFEIERSTDGVSFEKRGTVAVQNQTSYSFSDAVTGVRSAGIFYRIKAVMTDNSFAFSNIFYGKNGTAISLAVYPNPFQGSLSLQLQTADKGAVALIVRDLAGRTVVSKTVPVEKGVNYLQLTEMQSAQPGTYFIETTCGSERSFVKVVKQ